MSSEVIGNVSSKQINSGILIKPMIDKTATMLRSQSPTVIETCANQYERSQPFEISPLRTTKKTSKIGYAQAVEPIQAVNR